MAIDWSQADQDKFGPATPPQETSNPAPQSRPEPEGSQRQDVNPAIREPLNVTSPARTTEWLRNMAGQGPLSGLFKRGQAGRIFHTPLIGHAGYIEPGDGADDGPAQVQPISYQELAALTQFTFDCYTERVVTKDNEERVVRKAAMFPEAAAKVVCNASSMVPGLRQLKGVVHTPLVRKDGSILDVPGYDPASKMLYLPDSELRVKPVPEIPSEEQITEARELIQYMICDFPFTSDDQRAAYIGALITPLLRDMVPPPYKMIIITAHQAGSGKTFLASAIRDIHGGVFRSEMPESEAELRKQVTSILDMTTGPVVHIDNVTGVVRSSTLAGLTTSDVWDDRKLGSNDLARCVNDRLWVFTGNNMALGGDLVRRSVWSAIDPGIPNPELRKKFKILEDTGLDFQTWVRRNRSDVLHALLTLIRAWVSQGRPGTANSTDSYADWVRTLNGILAVAGIPGTFDALDGRGQDEGSEDEEWAGFLEALSATFGDQGFTSADVAGRVDYGFGMTNGLVAQATGIKLDRFPEDLTAKMRNGQISTRSLGRWIKNRIGRWAGGLTIREIKKDTVHGSTYKIQKSIR